MVNIKIEDIIFWIFILIIIGTALWLLHGSPPEMSAIITVGLAVAGSELLIWRTIFNIDKKTTIGFMKIKNDMEKMEMKIDNRFNQLDNKLNLINNNIRRK